VRWNSVRAKRCPTGRQRLPVEGPVFYQTELLKRRRGEKNSAQPCFPVPDILSSPFMQRSYGHRKLLSVPFYTLPRSSLNLDEGDAGKLKAGDLRGMIANLHAEGPKYLAEASFSGWEEAAYLDGPCPCSISNSQARALTPYWLADERPDLDFLA